MAKRGKNYRKVTEGLDPTKMYSLEEGVEFAIKDR
jgi:hypothetical protein